jgi:hypothetical protein
VALCLLDPQERERPRSTSPTVARPTSGPSFCASREQSLPWCPARLTSLPVPHRSLSARNRTVCVLVGAAYEDQDQGAPSTRTIFCVAWHTSIPRPTVPLRQVLLLALPERGARWHSPSAVSDPPLLSSPQLWRFEPFKVCTSHISASRSYSCGWWGGFLLDSLLLPRCPLLTCTRGDSSGGRGKYWGNIDRPKLIRLRPVFPSLASSTTGPTLVLPRQWVRFTNSLLDRYDHAQGKQQTPTQSQKPC